MMDIDTVGHSADSLEVHAIIEVSMHTLARRHARTCTYTHTHAHTHADINPTVGPLQVTCKDDGIYLCTASTALPTTTATHTDEMSLDVKGIFGSSC